MAAINTQIMQVEEIPCEHFFEKPNHPTEGSDRKKNSKEKNNAKVVSNACLKPDNDSFRSEKQERTSTVKESVVDRRASMGMLQNGTNRREGVRRAQSSRSLGLRQGLQRLKTVKFFKEPKTEKDSMAAVVEAQRAIGLYIRALQLSKDKNCNEAKINLLEVLKCDCITAYAVYNAIGNVHYREGNFIIAIKNYKDSLINMEENGKKMSNLKKVVLCNKAIAHLQNGETGESLKCFQIVLHELQRESAKDHDLRAKQIANLNARIGEVYYHMEDFDEAMKHYLLSFRSKVVTQGSEHVECAIIKHSIGLVLSKQGRFEEALLILREMLEMKSYTDSHNFNLAKVLLDISEIYIVNGYSKSDAKEYCLYAADILKTEGSPENQDRTCQLKMLLSRF